MNISAKMQSLSKFKGKRLFTLFLCVVFFQCHDSSVQPPENGEDPVRQLNALEKQIVQADNKFGLKIFSKIVQAEKDKNIFISPASISFALAMTLNGASGTTRDGMQNALELQGLKMEEINQNFKSLIDLLGKVDSKVEFKIANSIWYKKDMAFEEQFINDCIKYFYAEVKGVDFSKPEVLGIINSWIENNTNGKIKEVIDKIGPDVVMYLINAIYFKGSWTYSFDEKKTKDASFYLQDGSSKTCKMMVQSARYPYYENNEFQALDIPYGSGGFSMTILLPKPGVDINGFISKVNSESWGSLLSELAKDTVNIFMPKFKIEYRILLNDVLQALGMQQAFTGSADFTNMFKPGGLYISRVIHQTFVDVNEQGTEAAAVTVVEMEKTSIPSVNTFNANRPFMFAIRENNSQNILFIGKVLEPKYEQ